MTIREAVEDYLCGIISPAELYTDARKTYKVPIHEIAKIVVTLDLSGAEIEIYDVEKYVYDYGDDTYFEEDYLYYICYNNPKVLHILPKEEEKGRYQNVLDQSQYISKVEIRSKSEVSLHDLEQRYNVINDERQRYVANVFRDTFYFQLKYGLMDLKFGYIPHFIPDEFMKKYINHAQEELDEVKKAYESRNLYECADGLMDLIYVAAGLCGLMNLPSIALWQDVQNSNMAFKKRVLSLDDATKRHSTFDVKKCENWIAPRGKEIIDDAIRQGKEYGYAVDELGLLYDVFKHENDAKETMHVTDPEPTEEVNKTVVEDVVAPVAKQRRGQKNIKLNKARAVKDDEYYTLYEDVEEEMRHYNAEFEGKIIYCNCDNPYYSQFVKYFLVNFNKLKLKKFIASNYVGFLNVDRLNEELHQKPYALEVTEMIGENAEIDDIVKNPNNTLRVLNGDGSYNSVECMELMRESDIIVTNPPFSLFREIVSTLLAEKKQFLLMGSINNIAYKSIFPPFKDRELWLGYTFRTMSFGRPKGEEIKKIANICWYTNVPVHKEFKRIDFPADYDPNFHMKYVTFNAIHIEALADIPGNFAGWMGVPLTFFRLFNEEQFEVIGGADFVGKYGIDNIGVQCVGEKWIEDFKKSGRPCHYSPNTRALVIYNKEGIPTKPFKRLLVRNKFPRQPSVNLSES